MGYLRALLTYLFTLLPVLLGDAQKAFENIFGWPIQTLIGRLRLSLRSFFRGAAASCGLAPRSGGYMAGKRWPVAARCGYANIFFRALLKFYRMAPSGNQITPKCRPGIGWLGAFWTAPRAAEGGQKNISARLSIQRLTVHQPFRGWQWAGLIDPPEPTMKFMLMFFDAAANQAYAAETGPSTMAAWGAYAGAMGQAGVIVAGHGLQGRDTATTVRVRDGHRQVQDGPFADTKEQLGGYFVVDVPSLDDALAWAARSPTAATGTVEVRPVLAM